MIRSHYSIVTPPMASGSPTSPGPLGDAEFGVTPRQNTGRPSMMISAASRAMPSVTTPDRASDLGDARHVVAERRRAGEALGRDHQDVARLDQVERGECGQVVARAVSALPSSRLPGSSGLMA